MSKFNQSNKVLNATYEGGKAYEKDVANDWLNFIFTSFLQNTYYEPSEKQQARFVALTNAMMEKYGAEFVAKAAVLSRQVFGLRSIGCLTAAFLNNQKFDNKRKFYKDFCNRPDDTGEIFAAIKNVFGQKRSHACVRGVGDYISTLSEYQMGKYKMASKEFNLMDIINITHANSPVIDSYKRGTLSSPDTWENSISNSASKEERDAEWIRLVEEGKLGYLALIRNLRNILNCEGVSNEWVESNLVPQICNEEKIKKSKVFPYQIFSAYKYCESSNPALTLALSNAFMLSCGNVEPFEGNTCVILDVSGSMESSISGQSSMRLVDVGACYAAMLYLTQDCDFIKFGNNAIKQDYKKTDNIFDIIAQMTKNDLCGYGTYIQTAFCLLEKHYDRIIIVSDMQVMGCTERNITQPQIAYETFDKYTQTFGDCHVFSYDISNYPISFFPPEDNRLHFCSALNNISFAMIPYLEGGKNLEDFVNSYEL